jgi:hypothetical protein
MRSPEGAAELAYEIGWDQGSIQALEEIKGALLAVRNCAEFNKLEAHFKARDANQEKWADLARWLLNLAHTATPFTRSQTLLMIAEFKYGYEVGYWGPLDVLSDYECKDGVVCKKEVPMIQFD